jgi:Dicarboxylate transport
VRRRRVLWVMLACLLAPVALYALLPTAAAAGLKYVLHRQGYHHVTMQLGYPGWHTLQVPMLSFQKDLDGESLLVTVQDSRLEYDIGALFSGRVHRLIIPDASVFLRRRGGNDGQACGQSQTATAGPGQLASETVGKLLQPLPELPWRALVVEQVHVFRECATGPLRDVRISGTLHKTGASADGTVVFQGAGSAAYRLTFAGSHPGSLDVTLQTEPAAPSPIVAMQSHVRQGPSSIQLEGRASTDFAHLAPFLDLMLPMGVDLQNIAGTMQATWTLTAPPTASLATAWHAPTAVVSGTAALTLTLPKFAGVGDNLSVRFNGEVTGNAEQLAWTLSKDSRLEVELDRSLFLLPPTLQWLLPSKNRHVVLECLEPIKGQLRLTAIPPQFTVEGPIRAQYGAAQAPVQIEVALHRAAGQGAGHLTVAGTYRLMGASDKIPPDLLTTQQVQWDLQGTFALDDMHVRGTLETSSSVHLTELRTAAVEVPESAVQITEPFPLSVDLRTLRWAAGPAHVDIYTPRMVWQDTTVALDQVHLTLQTLQGDQVHWQTQGTMSLTGVAPQLATVPLPVTQWQASFAVDDAALRLEAHSTAFDAAVMLASRLEYAFTTQAGSAHLQLSPVQFDPSHLSWRKMVPLESFPVDVTGGHLSATASLTWGPEAGSSDHSPVLQTGSATLVLEQLSGQYESIVVNGLTTTLTLQTVGADMLTMPEPARVTIAAIQTGVEVTDLSLDMQLGGIPPATLEWVDMRNMSAAVFGGRVTSEGGRLDMAHPDQTFIVKAEQLDLQQLLHLEQQQGLQGTGILDGIIPVILTPTGMQVRDGLLEARPPGGVLQYQPAPETAQNVAPADAHLSLVLQALSNFHYNALKLGVQYEEDGTLKLTARLEGKNPDWQQGRPVHFNLSVQENVPALLKSLRVVQGIEQSLQEHLQRR